MRLTLLIMSLCLPLLAGLAKTSDAVDPKHIVGLWLFDDGAGNVAKDTSGNKHDGTISGAKWTKGKYEGALEFDGIDDFVEVPAADDLVLETFTIEAWVKIKHGPDWQSILMKGQEPRNYLLVTNKDNDVALLSFTSGGRGQWKSAFGKTPLTDDTWKHVAGAYDGKFMRVYVNGVMEGEVPQPTKPDKAAEPAKVKIGNGSADGHPIKGLLDEVALYSIALTEDEVKKSMEGLKKSSQDVDHVEKLAATWGQIKGERRRAKY